MMKNKLKRMLNGALALVMCVGTFSAVSYVKPMTADAANGSQEWYNPALRWKNTTNNRENVLIANSIVSTELMHCSNKNCPTNRNDGFNDMITGAGGNQGTYVSQSVGTIYRVPEYTADGEFSAKVDVNGNDIIESITAGESYQDEAGAWYYGPMYPINSGRLSEFNIGSDGNKPNQIPETDIDAAWTKAKAQFGKTFSKEDLVPGSAIFIGYKKTTNRSVAYNACRGSLGETVKEVDTDGDGNPDEYWIIDKNGNTVPEYRSGFMPYGYLKPNDKYDLTQGFRAIKDAKFVSPVSGGEYTKHHLTASYCNSCGVWGTSDNDIVNSQINNGMFTLNPCHICYGDEGGCSIDHGDNVEHEATTLKTQAGVEVEVSRTFSTQENRDDTLVHKITDNTIPTCIYCFGVKPTTAEEMYHIHPHVFETTSTQVSSENSISITKTCLGDEGVNSISNGVMDEIKNNNRTDYCVSASEGLTDGHNCVIHSKNQVVDKNGEITYDSADIGCGYQKTDIYTADVSVENYVGVVDGETHYVSFDGKPVVTKRDGLVNGEPVLDENGNETGAVVNGSGKLTARLTWDGDGQPPSRLLAGTASKGYTLTYSLPDGTGGDESKTIVKRGTATVTLIPGHVSDSAEGDKNYWDNSTVGNGNLGNILIGNLPQNDISTIEYSNVNFDLNAVDGIGNYDNYTIVTGAQVTDPGNDKGTITGQFILHGSCPNRGSGTTGTQTHAYQFMYSDTSVDFWKCIYCDAYLPIRTREPQVHIHHYYKYDEIPATCNTKGMIFRRCVCGAMETEDTAINPGNHVGTSHKIDPAPTCENEGYEYDECVGCGAKLNGQQMEKLGHQWSVTGVTNNFGHVPNYVIQTCDRCNKRKTISSNGISEDEIFVDGAVDMSSASHTAHYYEYRYTERECENGTYEIWQCSVCSEIERRLVESGKGHIWIEQGDKRDSTCTVNGYRNYICSNCGSHKLEMLPLDKDAHEHTVRTFSRPESEKCTHSFVEYETCTACNKTVNVVQNHDPLGHDYKVLLDTKATCHEMGHHVEQCLRCYEVVQEDTPVQDHNYVPTGTISESQCTVDGLRELACEYCGDLKYESIGMTGHTPGKEATCTEDQVCTVCGAVLEKAKAPSFPMTLLYLTTMQIVDKWTMLIRNRDMISDELTRCPIYLS